MRAKDGRIDIFPLMGGLPERLAAPGPLETLRNLLRVNTVSGFSAYPSLAVALSGALSAAEAASSTVVQLSPFQISSQKNVGYLANNTLAGSRTRTNLADVANAMSVFARSSSLT